MGEGLLDRRVADPPVNLLGGTAPLFALAVACAGGIAAAALFPSVGWFLAPLIIGGGWWFLRRDPRGAAALGLVFIAGAAVGFFRMPSPASGSFAVRDAVLEGYVLESPRRGGGQGDSWLFDLRERDTGRVYRVRSRGRSASEPGDVVRVTGTLLPLGRFLNPGARGWPGPLPSTGPEGVLRADAVTLVEIGKGPWKTVHRVRGALARRIGESIAEPGAGLLKALLLGMREVDPGTRDLFSRAGVAHLFAVSGTHLGMLALVAMFGVRFILLRVIPPGLYLRLSVHVTATQAAAALAIPLVVAYTLVSGARVPTLRALVMILSLLGGAILGGRHFWLNALGCAGLLILLYDPGALFGASFQLSFAAVGGIGLLISRTREGGPGDTSPGGTGVRRRRLLTWLLVPLAALAATGPLLVSYFGTLSLVSPLANLLITPLVGFLLVPTGLVWLLAGSVLTPVVDQLLRLVLALVAWFASVPGAVWQLPAPTPLWLFAYYGLFVIPLALRWRLPGMVLLMAIGIIPHPGSPSGGGLRAVFLDVGQGAAVLVKLPGGRNMLVDTGGPVSGRQTPAVVSSLRALGVSRLDPVVLTHLHPDHAGGLDEVLRSFPVGELWWSGRGTEDAATLSVASHQKVRAVTRGDVFEGEGYRIEVLNPPRGHSFAAGKEDYGGENSDSIVLRINGPGGAILLAGDIEEDAERDIVRLDTDLGADLLQVPHHGSRSSSTPPFVAMVKPAVAVVSAGRNNAFGHPHEEVSRRLLGRGAALYRTDRDGAVEVTFTAAGLIVKRWVDAGLQPGWSPGRQGWNLLRLVLGPSFRLTRGTLYPVAEGRNQHRPRPDDRT